MILRRLASIALIVVATTSSAFASVQFICQIDSGSAVHVAKELNATILDSTGDGTYLMSAESFPTQLPKGVSYVEPDAPIPVQPTAGAILSVPSTTPVQRFPRRSNARTRAASALAHSWGWG